MPALFTLPPVTSGEGFTPQLDEDLPSMAHQLMVLGGWLHGATETTEPSDHVKVVVILGEESYEVVDTGYGEEDTVRFRIRKRGDMQFHVLAVQFVEPDGCVFVSPSTVEAASLMRHLMEKGQWLLPD